MLHNPRSGRREPFSPIDGRAPITIICPGMHPRPTNIRLRPGHGVSIPRRRSTSRNAVIPPARFTTSIGVRKVTERVSVASAVIERSARSRISGVGSAAARHSWMPAWYAKMALRSVDLSLTMFTYASRFASSGNPSSSETRYANPSTDSSWPCLSSSSASVTRSIQTPRSERSLTRA